MDTTIEDLRNLNCLSKILIDLATLVGTLIIVVYSIKFIAELYKGFRLYVWSQFCCKPNLRERYGEWAVISGSTDGIGLSMAREFARRGFSLIVIGRNEEKLFKTKLSLEEEPNVGQVITVKIDLSDSSIENFERIRGQIDTDNRDIGILVNNAGWLELKFRRFYRCDMESLKTMVNVNILATVYLTRMILPGMIERGKGLVVNVASLSGLTMVPSPYMSIYGQTKRFVNSFSENLQTECSSHPVDIINLNPGFVDTNMSIKFTSDHKITDVPVVSPDYYAKSAINALATRYHNFSGCMFHGIIVKGMQVLDKIGLLPCIAMYSLEKHVEDYLKSSPAMKRKRGFKLLE